MEQALGFGYRLAEGGRGGEGGEVEAAGVVKPNAQPRGASSVQGRAGRPVHWEEEEPPTAPETASVVAAATVGVDLSAISIAAVSAVVLFRAATLFSAMLAQLRRSLKRLHVNNVRTEHFVGSHSCVG